MKLNFFIILIFLIPFKVKSDQIYELIKIPNLELYNIDKKGIRYLTAYKDFSAGKGINSVSCEKPEKNLLKRKFLLTEENIKFYQKNFLKKINLKFVILCEKLTVSNIPAIGFANPEMKTIILNVNSKEKIFQRVIHHEIFHIIHKNFYDLFDVSKWKKFNNPKFKYFACTDCEGNFSLTPLDLTNGFFTTYAKSSVSEDMAETFSFLIFNDKHSEIKIAEDTIIEKKTNFIKKNILKIYKEFEFKKKTPQDS